MEMKERYARQYSLKDFGVQGQEKLAKAKVLVVGAGGLGCPVLQYLAAAGIGKLGIVDHDQVTLSNLHRQPLFGTADVGQLKVEVAAKVLLAQNDDVQLSTYTLRLDNRNAWDIMEQYDIVVDCTDNFEARYILNDACVLLNKPLVYGAVYTYEGQVAVFNVSTQVADRVTYRDLFPTPPSQQDAPDCATAGVLGVLPGLIGLLQANEVIKLITGIGAPLVSSLLTFSLLDYQLLNMSITPQPQNQQQTPKSRADFEQMHYPEFCGTIRQESTENLGDILAQFADQPDAVIVDVRELHELPRLPYPHVSIPLGGLMEEVARLQATHILVCCQSGKRSAEALQRMQAYFGNTRIITDLDGGLSKDKTWINGN